MLLEIRHVTQYRYASLVRESVMEVWMQPQKSARQRLVSFDLDLDPPAQVFSYPDSFGNAVYHFDVPQPHDKLTITARSAVETQPAPPGLTTSTGANGTGCARNSCAARTSTSCIPTASPARPRRCTPTWPNTRSRPCAAPIR